MSVMSLDQELLMDYSDYKVVLLISVSQEILLYLLGKNIWLENVLTYCKLKPWVFFLFFFF